MEILGLLILFGVGCFMIGWGSRQDQIDFLTERCLYLQEKLFGNENIS